MHRQRFGRRLAVCFLAAFLISSCAPFATSAYSDIKTDRNYSYDQTGKEVYIPDAYDYAGSVLLQDSEGLAGV